MEADAIRNNAKDEELEAIRQAGEAAARNQHRERDVSLLYPDASPNTGTGSSTPIRSPNRQT